MLGVPGINCKLRVSLKRGEVEHPRHDRQPSVHNREFDGLPLLFTEPGRLRHDGRAGKSEPPTPTRNLDATGFMASDWRRRVIIPAVADLLQRLWPVMHLDSARLVRILQQLERASSAQERGDHRGVW